MFVSQMVYWRFIGGTTIGCAARRMAQSPFLPIFDYAMEGAATHADAIKYANRIKDDVIKGATFALKLSSFQDDARLMRDTVHHMKAHGVAKVFLDAEDDRVHQKEQSVYRDLVDEFNGDGIFIYKTYQMYRRDALNTMMQDLNAHPRLGIKLVRGAYLAKDGGAAKGVLWTSKSDVDLLYDQALTLLLRDHVWPGKVQLVVATHNNASIMLALKIAAMASSIDGGKNCIAFAQLLGMNDAAGIHCIKQGFDVYKYVPYGSMKEVMPYLVRRLYENYEVVKHML